MIRLLFLQMISKSVSLSKTLAINSKPYMPRHAKPYMERINL